MAMSWRRSPRPASSSSPYSSLTRRTHSYRLYCRKVDDIRWTFWCVRGTSNVNENYNYLEVASVSNAVKRRWGACPKQQAPVTLNMEIHISTRIQIQIHSVTPSFGLEFNSAQERWRRKSSYSFL
jgi:hypothetical protein